MDKHIGPKASGNALAHPNDRHVCRGRHKITAKCRCRYCPRSWRRPMRPDAHAHHAPDPVDDYHDQVAIEAKHAQDREEEAEARLLEFALEDQR